MPWLLLLDRQRNWKASLLTAYLLLLVVTLVVFGWFGLAIGRQLQIGAAGGLALLLLLAPLFQPQFLVFALVRRWGPVPALAGACAWVGVEWLGLKVLGDTLGHGLVPSPWLRQGAALGGAALLTVALLLVNEGLTQALRQRRGQPLLLALPMLLLAGFGGVELRASAPAGPQLRVALVQANITELEERRRAQGTQAVLRELLDTHLAMSWDAVERQGADLVLWSETVYPTSFGNPKSEAGAAFDAELLATLRASGRPFVFGTYEREGANEYNAAAFVDRERGLVGFYRKTRLFPFTERLPFEALRPLLPGAGHWQAGQGARVLPLRLRDGRELAVQALICRDAVDPQLAIDAARLGARALLTLSNDSWFNEHGARWHLAVASLRSVETRLPQFRVTANGQSAVIDPWGRVLASGGFKERTLVVGTQSVGEPPATLMLRFGDWVGGAAWVLLAGLLLLQGAKHLPAPQPTEMPMPPMRMPPALRQLAGLLRGFAHLALLGLGLALLLDESLRAQTLSPLRWFVGTVLLPEALAFCLLAAWRQRVNGSARELLLGARAPVSPYARARGQLGAGRWQSPWLKFGLLPLLLALPAFHLHQQIAYGAALGEFYTHGLRAYLLAFALWWGRWLLGVALLALVLRLAVEAGSWLAAVLRPAQALLSRVWLERAGLFLLYLGLPSWLLVRIGLSL